MRTRIGSIILFAVLLLITMGLDAQTDVRVRPYESYVRYFNETDWQDWGDRNEVSLLVKLGDEVVQVYSSTETYIYDRIGDYETKLSPEGDTIFYAWYVDSDGDRLIIAMWNNSEINAVSLEFYYDNYIHIRYNARFL